MGNETDAEYVPKEASSGAFPQCGFYARPDLHRAFLLYDRYPLANKASVVNIYIGQFKGEWAVQLNGDLISIDDIPARIEEIRGGMSAENADKLTVSLRADRHTPMGVITDVKQALQKSYALRINYSATELK